MSLQHTFMFDYPQLDPIIETGTISAHWARVHRNVNFKARDWSDDEKSQTKPYWLTLCVLFIAIASLSFHLKSVISSSVSSCIIHVYVYFQPLIFGMTLDGQKYLTQGKNIWLLTPANPMPHEQNG